MDVEVGDVDQRACTGDLPHRSEVQTLVRAAHERCTSVARGVVADYIPVLACADPTWFAVSVADVDGGLHSAGDVDIEFSIQSISKALVYALVCEQLGREVVRERVGVNNTGLPFNSVIAIELNRGHPANPMVNAGALATTALVRGRTPSEQWDNIQTGLSEFAGRPLELDETVYSCESATNQRNRAIARLLESYGRIDLDPLTVVDVYTKQCALRVTAADLAMMGATLAAGGVNPLTGRQVVSAAVCRDTLAVLAANGAYEHSGEWLFDIGLPGKSGVSGGVLTVAPGKAGIGVFSPPLDEAGNSVRGQRATAYLSKVLGLNIFASEVCSSDAHEV